MIHIVDHIRPAVYLHVGRYEIFNHPIFAYCVKIVKDKSRIKQIYLFFMSNHMMCALLHILPNGLVAEAGNPFLNTGVIAPGICLSMIWFVFATVLFLKWFERREVK